MLSILILPLQRRRKDFQSGGAWSLRLEISPGRYTETYYFMKRVGNQCPRSPNFDPLVSVRKALGLQWNTTPWLQCQNNALIAWPSIVDKWSRTFNVIDFYDQIRFQSLNQGKVLKVCKLIEEKLELLCTILRGVLTKILFESPQWRS